MNLPTDYQAYIHASRYARWMDDLGRRETWEETVSRYIRFFYSKYPKEDIPWQELKEAILALDVMPSMRCLMTAGVALERDNVAGYNCSYIKLNRVRAFDELMYVLMCGTGVGFSVERKFISLLPEVAEEFYDTETTIVVGDSKIGWASAFRELTTLLYAGKVPKWDLSKVRPAGARLKTFGGRASGPGPLDELFRFTCNVFKQAKGRKLTSVECHDLACKIADIVVVGGVRRSALISLSDLDDERMRTAKSGEWWTHNRQRALANNSVCYIERPDIGIFLKEWSGLYESKSGERGIFNRKASQELAARTNRRDASYEFGTNPCCEIVLRDREFCNLSEVVCRPTDSYETLERKVRIATILGSLQATLTDFRYLSKKWEENTKEEALLGVSLTGIMDNTLLSDIGNGVKRFNLKTVLQDLKQVAIETNEEYAKILGINPSASITCVKPSGTVSQLVDSASGIHPRYSNFYIRRVLGDAKDPLISFMQDQGVPCEDSVYYPGQKVLSFPMKAPENAVFRNDRDAISQLELWKIYAENWCEHKPSVTIYVKEHEWFDVGAWCYQNFDILSGVSFLPFDAGSYSQTPYEEISKQQYEDLVTKLPTQLNWEKLREYETGDNTSVQPELSCSAGVCEI